MALYFVIKENHSLKKESPIQVDPEIEPVYNYVQGCLDSSARDVIYTVALGGSYYDVIEEKSTENLGITYYIKDEKNLMPSKKKIEKEISSNIEEQVKNCSSHLESKFTGYEIKQDNISVETNIKQKEVMIKADYPLLIQKQNSKYKVNKFRKTIPVKMGIMYEAVSEFIKQEMKSSEEGICVSCVTEIASEYGLEFNVFQIDREGDKFAFMVTSSQEEINDKTFIYSFANKY